MNSYSEVIKEIKSKLRSKNASTLFINGPLGSGKTYLLNYLGEKIPGEIERTVVLGPYRLSVGENYILGCNILEDIKKYGFLENLPQKNATKTIVDTLEWFEQHSLCSSRYDFVFLLDLGLISSLSQEIIEELFSGLRNIEGNWKSRQTRVLFILAGHWDHPYLISYYKKRSISFPYTSGANYYIWEGVSQKAITRILGTYHPSNNQPIFGKVLFELTGGHPKIAIEIVKNIRQGELSIEKLLSTTEDVARSGKIGKELVQVWTGMPKTTRMILKRLLTKRYLPHTISDEHKKRLRTIGIAKTKIIENDNYLCFRSWFVELILHFYAKELDIEDENIRKIAIQRLLPKLTSLNYLAYSLVNDIENVARNFVTTELSLQKNNNVSSILADWPEIHSKAKAWKRKSTKAGLPAKLNPLLTFVSTRELATLVQEIGDFNESEEWLKIGKILEDLSDVRNAVMHNQLIDVKSLDKLLILQHKMYKSLGELD